MLTPTQREEIREKWSDQPIDKFNDPFSGRWSPELVADYWLSVLDQELAKREEAIKDLFRIRGEKPYLWIINNDTPTELGKYDENWRINGYNTAIRDILALLAPTEEK